MDPKNDAIAQIGRNGSWKSVLQATRQALEQMSRDSGPMLLILWASRGGGKTTLLEMIRDMLSHIQDVTLLGSWDAQQTSPNQLGHEISSAVEEASGSRERVVLLDNIDAFLHIDDGTAFFDFERDVIHKLIETGDTLTVATSQSKLNQWQECDLRARAQNWHVPALTPDDVKQLTTKWHLNVKRAFALTLGHPQVLDWLLAEPNLSEQEIGQRSEAYFLEALPKDARELAMVASLFPIFDIAILRSVLPSTESDNEGYYADYLDRLRELIGAGLIYWDVEVGAYRFTDSAVRRLVARSLHDEQPFDFVRIHQQAAEYYRSEARRAAYLHHSLVSALYHQAQAHQAERTAAAGAWCLQWVEANLKTWAGTNWKAVALAWQTGAGDPAVVDELQTLIGPQTYDHITQLLTASEQTMEVPR